MNNALDDDLACGMDDMGDFMHTDPPPFPSITHAIGIPAPRAPRLYTVNGLVAPGNPDFLILTSEQSRTDMHRRDSIKRGGI